MMLGACDARAIATQLYNLSDMTYDSFVISERLYVVSNATPKTARGENTRRAILDAAEEIIGASGYNDASIAEITRKANVAQGTFYIYFVGKAEVFRELVLEMGRILRHDLTEATQGLANRLDAEKEGLRAFLTFAAAHPNLYRIIQEALFVDPDAYRAYFNNFSAAYRDALAAAAERGDIRPGDADVRAWALMGMSKTLGERYAVWNETRPIDEVVEITFDLISRGLAP